MSEEKFSFLKAFDELRKLGVELANYHVAEPYEGDFTQVNYQLVLKQGIFSNNVILAADRQDELQYIKGYIAAFPPYHKLFIRHKPTEVRSGYWTLKHVSRCIGTDTKEQQIKHIVLSMGGTRADVDYVLHGVEETTLGYFPFTDKSVAEAYTRLIDAGANRPATDEEICNIQDLLIDYAKSHKS